MVVKAKIASMTDFEIIFFVVRLSYSLMTIKHTLNEKPGNWLKDLSVYFPPDPGQAATEPDCPIHRVTGPANA